MPKRKSTRVPTQPVKPFKPKRLTKKECESLVKELRRVSGIVPYVRERSRLDRIKNKHIRFKSAAA